MGVSPAGELQGVAAESLPLLVSMSTDTGIGSRHRPGSVTTPVGLHGAGLEESQAGLKNRMHWCVHEAE